VILLRPPPQPSLFCISHNFAHFKKTP
jgi:hypothetical protein